MADLANILTSLGAADVRTYIQSGNAVFEGNLNPENIANIIEINKGFRPCVLLLSAENFKAIAAATPVPDAIGNQLHIWFVAEPFQFDHITSDTLRKPSERISVTSKAIYLHAPDGIGRSKLAEKIERLAGVDCTARNLNTVNKILGMIG
ncbi:MAG: DUF1697 domain-containing protein [Rhodobacteraceae bacterium]|nr:DUF1697 domain-containing protein [Paracoccaceae bacterium]